MKKKLSTILVVFVLMLYAAPILTFAQQSTNPADKSMSQKDNQKMAQGNGNLSSQDREFIMKAAEGGQMEVTLGQTAVSKATNSDVKQFAQRMVDDHSKASEELKGLASSKGITLPMENAAKTQKMKADMEKHSAANFDREYMKDMVKDHEKDVAMFEREARDGKDSEVKAWAEKTLPTLREHLQMARDAASKVGAGTGTETKGNKGMKDTTKPPQK